MVSNVEVASGHSSHQAAAETEALGTFQWSLLETFPQRAEKFHAEVHHWRIYRAARPGSFVVLRPEPEALCATTRHGLTGWLVGLLKASRR